MQTRLGFIFISEIRWLSWPRWKSARAHPVRPPSRLIPEPAPSDGHTRRLSIPYTPPPPPLKDGEEPPVQDTLHLVLTPEVALPTGEVIKRPFKDFGYQLYFGDPQSTIDIQENVCSPRPLLPIFGSDLRHLQLDRFLHAILQKLKADNTLQIPITEATIDGLNVVSTQFGDAVKGKTPVDPNLPIVLNHEVNVHSTELIVISI